MCYLWQTGIFDFLITKPIPPNNACIKINKQVRTLHPQPCCFLAPPSGFYVNLPCSLGNSGHCFYLFFKLVIWEQLRIKKNARLKDHNYLKTKQPNLLPYSILKTRDQSLPNTFCGVVGSWSKTENTLE